MLHVTFVRPLYSDTVDNYDFYKGHQYLLREMPSAQ